MCAVPLSDNSAALLAHLADNLPDVIYRRRLWPDESYEYINATVERISGYTPAEFYADPDFGARIVHPADLLVLRQLAETATDAVLEYTMRWRCKDGSIRHMHQRDRILRDDTGRSIAVEGVARDVTAEMQSQAALHRVHEIFDLAGDAIFTWSPDACLTSWNSGAARLFGWDADEAIGRNVHELLHTRFPEPLADIMRTIAFIGHWEGQLVHTTRDGQQVAVNSQWARQRNADGSLVGFLEISHDLQARRRIEEENRAVAERLQLALQVASIGVWDSSRAGQTVVWDERMCEMHGIEPLAQVTYEQWRGLLHPDDVSSLVESAEASIASGEPQAVEYRVVQPDGSIRYVQAMGKALLDADGAVMRQIGVCMDITERKTRERDRRFLAAIVESSPDAIIGRDAGGLIVSWNAGAERLYGYTAAEAIGQPITIIAVPDDRARMAQAVAGVTQGNTVTDFEKPRMTKDGRIVETSVTAAPVYDEHGRIVGAASISRDITERKRMEQELRDSEARFRMMAELMPVAQVLVRVEDDIILYANSAAGQLAGVPAQQLLGVHGENFYHLETEQKEAFLADVRRSGVLRGVELKQVRPNGEIFWGLASAAFGVYHGVEVVLATVQDISERKQAEMSLAEREAQLRAVIENTSNSIWSIDRDYRLLVGNSTFDRVTESQLGRRLSAGESVLDASYPPETKEFWKPIYDRVFAGETVEVQIESALRPGNVLACSINPIRDVNGGIRGATCRAVNITQRLQREAKLRETVQQLQLAVGAAGIGVWKWTFADRSLEWDDRMYEMYAIDTEARARGLLYEDWRSRVHPDDLAEAEATLDEGLRLNQEWNARFRIVLPDGSIRHIQGSSALEYDRHGNAYRMIGVNRDITEQRLYEQLLQDTNILLEQRVNERTAELNRAIEQLKTADRMKDEFLAAMSHELRTPLSGILGMADMLSTQLFGPITESQQHKLELIKESGTRLLKLVNELLRYANLTAGKAMLRRERCSLGEVGSVCVSKTSRAAMAKHLEVAYVVSSPAPVIISDAERVVEMINDLLDNAIKFTPAGGSIGLEISETEDAVHLLVWDTGIGIGPEMIRSIFEPFVQGDGGLARRYEGVGLGLAYAARLATALGGTIAVSSEIGNGSRFTVTLPKE